MPDWLVRLLVQQLYDSATDVVKLALSVLEDICQDDDVLEQVLALQPALELVGEHSAELLKRYSLLLASPYRRDAADPPSDTAFWRLQPASDISIISTTSSASSMPGLT